jgi:hypothetical protein
MAISSPLTPKTSEKTIKNLQGIILNKTKVSRETFRTKTILQDRRIENDRRALQEDALEAPDIVRKPGGAAQLIAGSAKGFFERLMGFLGYLTAGWLLSNLPTWIGMGKEFIARTVKMGNLIGGFLFNTTTIFNNLTSLLGATLTNIIAFDFLDTSGRVGTAFEELQLSVDNWGTGFEDALNLITTPLTEGVASGEDTPPPGTQYTDEGAYETPPSSGGSGESGQLLATNAKSTYYDPSLGGINASGAKTREGLPATSTGEGYKPNVFSAAAFPPLLAKLPKSMTVPTQDPKFPGGRTLKEPFNIIVTNSQGKKAVIRVNDVGPGVKGHSSNHMLDLSVAAKNYLGTGGGFTIEMAQSGATPGPVTSKSTASAPSQSTLPSLPPTDTLSGGVQRYGASRDRGARKHAGVDFDISGPNAKFYSRIGGVVAGGQFRYGEDGWATDIYNQQLGVYERIAEAAKIVVKPGQTIKPGDLVAVGESGTGVIHYEIRKKVSGGFESTVDPIAFLKNSSSISKSSSPAQLASQSPAPAQLASQSQSQSQISQSSQALTPERTGPTVIVTQNPSSPARQMMYSGGGGSSGGGSPQMSDFALLNNFIKNKLLLDLAYL